ncbi:MAG: TIGR01212 family radical SAM protein, partial [Campylobacteraceae bacterium]|nr:TIGR01212 family radical SAM protein [Campylobacteraceae bacterium]
MTATTLSNKKVLTPLFTTGRYFKQKFGLSVYKIPVSIMGFTCPNIDGRVAKGGCIFCENESFSPNIGAVSLSKKFRLNQDCINPHLANQLEQLESQVEKTKTKLTHKF